MPDKQLGRGGLLGNSAALNAKREKDQQLGRGKAAPSDNALGGPLPAGAAVAQVAGGSANSAPSRRPTPNLPTADR